MEAMKTKVTKGKTKVEEVKTKVVTSQVAWGKQFLYWLSLTSWNQRGMANKIGVTEQALSQWIQGKTRPDKRNLGQLIELLYREKVWEKPGKVLDWVALLGVYGRSALELVKDERVRVWL
ncbi:MAG: hypothetical protein DRN95_08180, partial [Candidatus Hydrothermarchaeota archaeon]